MSVDLETTARLPHGDTVALAPYRIGARQRFKIQTWLGVQIGITSNFGMAPWVLAAGGRDSRDNAAAIDEFLTAWT